MDDDDTKTEIKKSQSSDRTRKKSCTQRPKKNTKVRYLLRILSDSNAVVFFLVHFRYVLSWIDGNPSFFRSFFGLSVKIRVLSEKESVLVLFTDYRQYYFGRFRLCSYTCGRIWNLLLSFIFSPRAIFQKSVDIGSPTCFWAGPTKNQTNKGQRGRIPALFFFFSDFHQAIQDCCISP